MGSRKSAGMKRYGGRNMKFDESYIIQKRWQLKSIGSSAGVIYPDEFRTPMPMT